MRQTTQRKIDALHAQIAELIDAEKRHHDKSHAGENDLWRHVAHTRLEMARHCPGDRENMRYAVAAFQA
jgi:hypothetical protein